MTKRKIEGSSSTASSSRSMSTPTDMDNENDVGVVPPSSDSKGDDKHAYYPEHGVNRQSNSARVFHPLLPPPSLHHYGMPPMMPHIPVHVPYPMPPIVSPNPSHHHHHPPTLSHGDGQLKEESESSSSTAMPSQLAHHHHHYHCPPPMHLPLPPPSQLRSSPPPPTESSSKSSTVPSSSRLTHETMLASIDFEIKAILDQEMNILERATAILNSTNPDCDEATKSASASASTGATSPATTNGKDGSDSSNTHNHSKSPSDYRSSLSSSSWGNLMCRLLYDTNRRKKQLQNQKDQVLKEMYNVSTSSTASNSKPSSSSSSSSLSSVRSKYVPKSVTISPSHSAFNSSYAHSNTNARVAYSNSSSNRSGRVGGGGANLVPNQHHNHHQSYPSSTTKRNQQIHHVHPHTNVSRNRNKKHRMNPIQTKNIDDSSHGSVGGITPTAANTSGATAIHGGHNHRPPPLHHMSPSSKIPHDKNTMPLCHEDRGFPPGAGASNGIGNRK